MNTEQTICQFFAAGKPEPAGSKKAFAFRRKTGGLGASVVDANPKAKQWQGVVAHAAHCAMDGRDIAIGPVELRVVFYVQRPSSHFGTGRNANTVKASAPEWPTGKPDALKLTRAVEDAMTDVVWKDDAQIVREFIEKRYAIDGKLGVRVTVLPANLE